MSDPAIEAPPTGSYARDSVEFGRVLAFSDGLFAIAMTLLVVGIAVPTLADGGDVGELADALNDDLPSFVSFFISFAVIGRYWVAHHQFFALLGRVDGGLIWINLLYLALIAFLPFPTGLLGAYSENPLSVGIYALTAAAVSGLEVVLLGYAHRHRLIARELPDDVYRWVRTNSLAPVLFFVLSVPVAFANTTVALFLWLGSLPFGLYMDRRKPERADDYL